MPKARVFGELNVMLNFISCKKLKILELKNRMMHTSLNTVKICEQRSGCRFKITPQMQPSANGKCSHGKSSHLVNAAICSYKWDHDVI